MKVEKRPDVSRMKTLDCRIDFESLSLKSAEGALHIAGWANTSDKDRVGEIVLPEAFEKSLGTYKENPVLLFQHNWDSVIGSVVESEITERGLWVKAKISNAKDVDDIRTKIREGVFRTFSIGYNEVDSTFDEKSKTKIVKELELLEISVVTIPANAQAKFKPVDESTPAPSAEGAGKSQDSSDVTKALSRIETQLAEQRTVIESVQTQLKSHHDGDTMKGTQDMKTKTTPAAEPAKEPVPAQDGAKADEGKPAAEGDAAAKAEAMDMGKLMEAMAAMAAEMAALKDACMAVLEAAKAAKPKEEEAPKKEDEEPKKDEMAKSLEKMSEDEVIEELEQIEAELAAIAEE